MNKKKRRYDADFKKEIAQIYLDGRRTAPSPADELGIHVNTVYKWSEQYRADLSMPFPAAGT